MADNVKPGSNVTRGNSIPVHRVPGGTNGGQEISPDMLRNDETFGVDGVNSTPKAPRTDPSTYDYKVDR